jgi:hypothetical protein
MHHTRFVAIVFVTAALCGWTSTANAQPPTISADAFVASTGVNLHLHYFDTIYNTFPLVRQRVIELGVRHVRDGLVDSTDNRYYTRFDSLAEAGIRATFIVAPNQSTELWKAFPSRMPRAFEAYEAPNEWDKSGDPNWPTTLRQTMQRMQTLKSDARSAPYPIIGPSLTTQEAYAQLGDVSASYDAGNLHNYMGGRNPGTPGWSVGGYGSIAWSIGNLRPYGGGKPIVATENGYVNDTRDPDNVPADVAGIYMPRLLMEQYRAGIARTYIYELLDWQGVNSYGLLNRDFSPKPAFRSVSGLLKLLEDPGPAFTPQNLAYAVHGGTADVRHMTFQKRDGSYYLALWQEVPSFDNQTRQRLSTTPQAVTVALASPMRFVNRHIWQGDGLRVSAPVALTTASIPVQVTEFLTVIQLAPPPTGAPAAVPGVPGTLSALVQDHAVHFRWQTPVDGGAPTEYVIEAAPAAAPAQTVTLNVGNVTEKVVPNVGPGVYIARVRASNGHGFGDPTNVVQFAVGVPGPPALAPAQVAGRRVSLAWAPGQGAAPTSYTLVVGTAPGAGNVGIFPLGRATSIAADSPIAGTLHAHVIAQGPMGAATSNGIAFTVGQPTAGAPAMNQAIVVGTSVRLSWSPVAGATSYTLIARVAPGGPPVATFPLGGSTIDIHGAPRGTFYVTVVAHAGSVRSAESNITTVVIR